MKITNKMKKELQHNSPTVDRKLAKILKNWDSGAMLEVDLNWDYENHIFSTKEVVEDFKKYLERWSGIKKFKMAKKPNVKIKFIR